MRLTHRKNASAHMPDFISSNFFITFLIGRLRGASFFASIKKAAAYLKRVFVIGRIIKYIGIAISVIQTSAVLIAAAAFVLILIPVILVMAIAAFIADRAVGSRIIKSPDFSEYLKRKHITVFYEAGNFGREFAEELAEKGDAVFVLYSAPTKLFICAEPKNGVYYLRHPFYFRLKRKYFRHRYDSITFLL